MQNPVLGGLNFQKLLHYPDGPTLAHKFETAVTCTGYCVSCEEKGLLEGSRYELDQMSHAADTSDFESLLGPLPSEQRAPRTVFLLESPGGYYGNGKPIDYQGLSKQPPVFHYYWTPHGSAWPKEANHDGKYGPYFAYLMQAHGFHAAYITNVVKCALADRKAKKFVPYQTVKDQNHPHSKVINNCFKEFLEAELLIFQPELVFYFGSRSSLMGYRLQLSRLVPGAVFTRLLHPSARGSFSRLVQQNDLRIRSTIEKRSTAVVS